MFNLVLNTLYGFEHVFKTYCKGKRKILDGFFKKSF